MHRLTIHTRQAKEVIDITGQVNALAARWAARTGVCHVFVAHTTAAITTADLDPGTDLDMLDAFTTMIPALDYRHPHNPAHVPDHILSTLIGPSVTLPVEGGRMVLGTWQRVVLFEFDGPRQRHVIVTFTSESES
jgi:secondary thiamine-phosphate synthase enzyme